MDYLTTMEMSKEWGISSRRIAVLCKQNSINGVIKKRKNMAYPARFYKACRC